MSNDDFNLFDDYGDDEVVSEVKEKEVSNEERMEVMNSFLFEDEEDVSSFLSLDSRLSIIDKEMEDRENSTSDSFFGDSDEDDLEDYFSNMFSDDYGDKPNLVRDEVSEDTVKKVMSLIERSNNDFNRLIYKHEFTNEYGSETETIYKDISNIQSMQSEVLDEELSYILKYYSNKVHEELYSSGEIKTTIDDIMDLSYISINPKSSNLVYYSEGVKVSELSSNVYDNERLRSMLSDVVKSNTKGVLKDKEIDRKRKLMKTRYESRYFKEYSRNLKLFSRSKTEDYTFVHNILEDGFICGDCNTRNKYEDDINKFFTLYVFSSCTEVRRGVFVPVIHKCTCGKLNVLDPSTLEYITNSYLVKNKSNISLMEDTLHSFLQNLRGRKRDLTFANFTKNPSDLLGDRFLVESKESSVKEDEEMDLTLIFKCIDDYNSLLNTFMYKVDENKFSFKDSDMLSDSITDIINKNKPDLDKKGRQPVNKMELWLNNVFAEDSLPIKHNLLAQDICLNSGLVYELEKDKAVNTVIRQLVTMFPGLRESSIIKLDILEKNKKILNDIDSYDSSLARVILSDYANKLEIPSYLYDGKDNSFILKLIKKDLKLIESKKVELYNEREIAKKFLCDNFKSLSHSIIVDEGVSDFAKWDLFYDEEIKYWIDIISDRIIIMNNAYDYFGSLFSSNSRIQKVLQEPKRDEFDCVAAISRFASKLFLNHNSPIIIKSKKDKIMMSSTVKDNSYYLPSISEEIVLLLKINSAYTEGNEYEFLMCLLDYFRYNHKEIKPFSDEELLINATREESIYGRDGSLSSMCYLLSKVGFSPEEVRAGYKKNFDSIHLDVLYEREDGEDLEKYLSKYSETRTYMSYYELQSFLSDNNVDIDEFNRLHEKYPYKYDKILEPKEFDKNDEESLENYLDRLLIIDSVNTYNKPKNHYNEIVMNVGKNYPHLYMLMKMAVYMNTVLTKPNIGIEYSTRTMLEFLLDYSTLDIVKDITNYGITSISEFELRYNKPEKYHRDVLNLLSSVSSSSVMVEILNSAESEVNIIANLLDIFTDDMILSSFSHIEDESIINSITEIIRSYDTGEV